MKRLLTIVALLIGSKYPLAQTLSSLQGKIVDANTKQPLEFVTVYFANSSLGTLSQADGSFKIEKIPIGKYDLIASMVGYGRFSKAFEFDGSTIDNFVVQLNPVATALDSMTVSARREKRTQGAYIKFERLFLGQTSNAYACKILNKNEIYAFETDQKLTAYAKNPILVLNNALGYKVHYDLKEFDVDFAADRFFMLGQVWFEELTPVSEKQEKKWKRERDRAYYGSHVHFLRSLLAGKLKENFFTIRRADGDALREADVIKDGVIQFNGLINVDYSKENSERPRVTFGRQSMVAFGQQSQITLNGQPVKVYENGYFEDFRNIVFSGQFQVGNVADQVPLGFSPSSPLK